MLKSVLIIGAILLSANSYANESGIRGQVTMGPMAPGPASATVSQSEAPVTGRFLVLRDGEAAAGFRTDENGRFTVVLTPGTYIILPSKDIPVPFPQTQITEVKVQPGAYTEVRISLDTGMK